MTEEIMQSFQELLSQTDWIDKETKELAAQKVDAMLLQIGYPDFILNPQLLNDWYKDVSGCTDVREIHKHKCLNICVCMQCDLSHCHTI